MYLFLCNNDISVIRFHTRFPSGRVAEAAALGGLEIPRGIFHQSVNKARFKIMCHFRLTRSAQCHIRLSVSHKNLSRKSWHIAPQV